MISGYRSRHAALPHSISWIFHRRFHALIDFSREIVEYLVEWSSYQTSEWVRYRFVNPSTKPLRCCQALSSKSDVTPTYKVPRVPLASM